MKLTGSHINGQVQIVAIGSQILYRSKSNPLKRSGGLRRLLLMLGLTGVIYLWFRRKGDNG